MESIPKVTLNGVSYAVMRYEESDQPVFGARFGSGAENESDLTMNKTLSFYGREANSLGEDRVGALSPRLAMGMIDYDSGVLAPAKRWTRGTNLNLWTSSSTTLVTSTVFNGSTYVGMFDGSTYRLAILGVGGSPTFVTLPSSFTSHASGGGVGSEISFAVLNGVLYLSNGSPGMHAITGPATLTKVASSTGTFKQIFNLNERMYAVNLGDTIYDWTGATKYTKVASINELKGNDYSANSIMDVLNGRAYIRTANTIWGFDGVRAYQVFKGQPQFMQTYDGAIYFDDNGYLIRFNGGTFEKLYYIGDMTITDSEVYGGIMYLSTGKRYKGIIPATPPAMPTVVYERWTLPEKYLATSDDITNNASGGNHLLAFDGSNLTYVTNTNDIGFAPASSISVDYLFLIRGARELMGIAVTDHSSPRNYLWLLTVAPSLVRVSFRAEDFDLPNINKLIRGFTINFNAPINTPAGKEIRVYYRTVSQNQVPSSWVVCAAATGSNITSLDLSLSTAIPSDKRIELMVEAYMENPDELAIGLSSFSVRYLLQTPLRRQYNMSLNVETDSINDMNAAPDYTYLNNIRNLRATQEVFAFVDIEGQTKTVLVDSYTIPYTTEFEAADGSDNVPPVVVVLREA